MQTLIAADEARARKLEILTSIPGIAATTAAGLLAEMPELGALSGKAAASLAGLAASARVGGLAIRGGRARARRLRTCRRCPPCLEPRLGRGVPEAERARSPARWPSSPMRKLIVRVRQDRTWLPVRLLSPRSDPRRRGDVSGPPRNVSRTSGQAAGSLLTAMKALHALGSVGSPEGPQPAGGLTRRSPGRIRTSRRTDVDAGPSIQGPLIAPCTTPGGSSSMLSSS